MYRLCTPIHIAFCIFPLIKCPVFVSSSGEVEMFSSICARRAKIKILPFLKISQSMGHNIQEGGRISYTRMTSCGVSQLCPHWDFSSGAETLHFEFHQGHMNLVPNGWTRLSAKKYLNTNMLPQMYNLEEIELDSFYWKKVFYRVTVPFATKSQLAEISYP